MIKIASYIENEISHGGGYKQAVTAVLQMEQMSKGNFNHIIFTVSSKNIKHLNSYGLNAHLLKAGFIDKLLAFLSHNAIFHRLQSKLKYIGSFERRLIQEQVDLIYFVTPSPRCRSLQILNYIFTVWDVCHRDNSEFPEVRNFNVFQIRENIYQNCLTPAAIIVVDSKELSIKLVNYYGVDVKRIIVMPFSPPNLIEKRDNLYKMVDLKKFNLPPDYFFYPAQFWAHKNHIRILEALDYIRLRWSKKFNIVLVGGDGGNLIHVRNKISSLRLESQVSILGFVSDDEIVALYKSCHAVIMPTYFGPTNLPPLEAWLHKKPLIYSRHLSEGFTDAALPINPDQAIEIAQAMLKTFDVEYSNKIVDSGTILLDAILSEVKRSERVFLEKILTFEKRVSCWK